MFGIGNLEGMSPETHAMMERAVREEFKRTATVRAALPQGPEPVDRWFVSVPTVQVYATDTEKVLKLEQPEPQRPHTIAQAFQLDSTEVHAPELVEMLARRVGQGLGVEDSERLYQGLLGCKPSRVRVDEPPKTGTDASLKAALEDAVSRLYDDRHYGPHVLLLKSTLLNRYRSLVNSKDGRGFITDSLGGDLKTVLAPKGSGAQDSLGLLVSLGSGAVDVVAFDSVGLSVSGYASDGRLTLLAQTRVALRVLDASAVVEFYAPPGSSRPPPPEDPPSTGTPETAPPNTQPSPTARNEPKPDETSPTTSGRDEAHK